jgi:hypothetical protein
VLSVSPFELVIASFDCRINLHFGKRARKKAKRSVTSVRLSFGFSRLLMILREQLAVPRRAATPNATAG